MTLYPINSPVLAGQFEALVHFGSLERSFSIALDAFGGTPTGLNFPSIAPYWRTIHQTALTAGTVQAFLDSTHRLFEDAQMVAGRFRDYQSRLSPDATARIVIGQGTEEARLQERRERALFAEMKGNLSPDARATWVPGRSGTWFLSLSARSQRLSTPEAVFVNEDGRCVHLGQFHGDSLLLGYGLYAGAMHYMEISPKTPTGRGRALFLQDRDPRTDATSPWFTALARSLQLFYTPQREPVSGLVRVGGTDRARKTRYESKAFLLTDGAALTEAFQQVSPAHEFTIETEETVAGRRGSSLSTINALVPLGSIRYVPGKPHGTVTRAYYLSERSQFLGESGLPEEMRKRLRFPMALAARTPTQAP